MKKQVALFLLSLLCAYTSMAYEYRPGDWLVKGVAGGSINVVREDAATRQTPGAGALLGLEVEFMLDRAWSVTGGIHPMIAPGFLDLGFAVGAKYRWTSTDMPFIPFVSVSITPAILIPVNPSAAHFNLGLRPTVGCDYFVMRDLSVGAELALEPSVLFGSGYSRRVEFTVDILAGATWRF